MRSPIFIGIALMATPAIANEPPPRHLFDSGGTVCILRDENGTVVDAFMGVSTGSRRKDGDFLTYARQLRWWGQKGQGEEPEGWFAMSFMSKIPDKPPVKPDCQALAAKR